MNGIILNNPSDSEVEVALVVLRSLDQLIQCPQHLKTGWPLVTLDLIFNDHSKAILAFQESSESNSFNESMTKLSDVRWREKGRSGYRGPLNTEVAFAPHTQRP